MSCRRKDIRVLRDQADVLIKVSNQVPYPLVHAGIDKI